ncbi:MAG: nucleoside-triphosphatase [Elusimicrobiota bacterium]
MSIAVKNIFLTGAPSSGKTTVIKKIIKSLTIPANGFYTEEENTDSKRVGFMMKTIDGKTGYLAHQDIKSGFHIRRYGVSLENIEAIAVPSIMPVDNNIIILDEIGKMECFSETFKEAAVAALDSPNIVIGTITFGGDDFIQGIKSRKDIEIIEVTQDNRDSLPSLILRKITSVKDIA